MSLANKYRPLNFKDVIGQPHVTEILQAEISSEKTSNHNYLFFGPRGTGKTTCARILAKALNCTDIQADGNPCNQCTNCISINKQNTLDYIEIDAASHTGVDNIREEIIDKVPYPPTHLKKKVYVIDEVHMLSNGAFNALLKTIEEPADNVCFILATTEIHKIPETIISRCQVFNFKKVAEEDLLSNLKNIADQEKITYTEDALKLIAKIAEGSPRDANKYLDQISILWDITQEHVSKFLGVAPEAQIKNFLESAKQKDKNIIFQQIDKLAKQGIDLNQFARQVLMYIDEHLQKDTDFLIAISEVFTDILSNIKYYPYPTIIYKIAFNKYFSTSTASKPSTSISTSISTSTPTSTPSLKSKPQEHTEKPVSSNNTSDNTDLLPQLLAHLKEESLKQNFKDYLIINKVKNNIVYIIVINKMTDLLLKKENIIKEIEEIFSKILWAPHHISVTFQKKEDYFASQV